MPLLLRTVRQSRWYKTEAARWLEKGDVPSDPLGDLATTDNCLSVWEVEADRSNIERIVRAVGVGRERIADMGYVVFDSALLSDAGIAVQVKDGASHDQGANKWHRDLIDLSGNKLVRLTMLILRDGDSGVVLKGRLRELVAEGVRLKELPEDIGSKFSR
jgi:hypothetical protein